jgi:hypothetical protein
MLLQKVEGLRHLFFRCPFAKNCWAQIGINVPTWLIADRAIRHIKRKLRVPFAMEIIIIMCWCIWIERNLIWLLVAKKDSKENLIWLSIDHGQ